MKIEINADILRRFMDLKKLKIEIKDKKCFLVGTNNTIACVQYLGVQEQADDSCYIDVTKSLQTLVYKELNNEGFLTFETIPEIAMGNVTDSKGQSYNDIIIWPDESPLDKWREWFKLSTESSGFMYCTVIDIDTLWHCSPSGQIVFPEVINASEPVIVRDITDANWLGVFIPAVDGKAIIKPATLPEWL